jgi:hypothetical protein
LFLPINTAFEHAPDAFAATVDAILFSLQMRRIYYFFTFFYADIPGITVNNLILLTDELMGRRDVMYVSCGRFKAVHISAAGIHADVAFHTELVLVAFLGLMHLSAIPLKSLSAI